VSKSRERKGKFNTEKYIGRERERGGERERGRERGKRGKWG